MIAIAELVRPSAFEALEQGTGIVDFGQIAQFGGQGRRMGGFGLGDLTAQLFTFFSPDKHPLVHLFNIERGT